MMALRKDVIPRSLHSGRLEGRRDSDPADGPLAEIRDLSVHFVTREATVHAVNGVSFSVNPGEVLCILGESGSGKSVTLRALMRLLPPRRTKIEGSVRVCGEDVLAMSAGALRDLRGGLVSMIFQEPMTALDPVYTVGQQIGEAVRRHTNVSRAAARARALELLELVRIPSAERRLDAYPHELSGGLRQRAMIAMALSCNPKLLLADEPTTALDATVQVQVLILLRRLQRELGMGMIFVTHDLGVAAEIADDAAVMYAGRIVEQAPIRELFRRPAHPYTEGLMHATVRRGQKGQALVPIPGAPPNLAALPPGCAFAPRCAHVRDVCVAEAPAVHAVGAGHLARCHLVPERFGRPRPEPSSVVPSVNQGGSA